MQVKTEYTTKHIVPEFDRRSGVADRRKNSDRRVKDERRHDFRDGTNGQRKTLRMIFRSLTNARLGVDRRKVERRINSDRRNQRPKSLLTQEELSDLLS